MADPMRIRAVAKDGIVNVKVLMSHEMETGQRKDSAGNLVPAHFIQSVTATYNGKTVLSAQCTDARVNLVTPALFARFPDAPALAEADPRELEKIIQSTGFFRNKAKNMLGAARVLMDDFDGQVPRTMEALLTLPGVARKTANVVLGTAFGLNEGFVVDTHIGRLSQRLGFTREINPVKIERVLMDKLPREKWTQLGHQLIWHGRRICHARKPECGACPLQPHCPSAGKV